MVGFKKSCLRLHGKLSAFEERLREFRLELSLDPGSERALTNFAAIDDKLEAAYLHVRSCRTELGKAIKAHEG